MKKFILKLLKNWTDPSGKTWDAGQIVEIEAHTAEEKAAVADLINDGIAEKANKVIAFKASAANDDGSPDIANIVKAAVDGVVKDKTFADNVAQKVHAISTKDLSDDDPTHGYLPPHADGRKHTRPEIEHGLGLFAMDVAKAYARGGRTPERLQKCIERSEALIKSALADGLIDAKAAGTGLTIGDGESAGALLPPEFNTALLDEAMTVASIRPRATKIPCSLAGIEFPKPKNYDHSSSTIFGGIRAYWLAENASLTESAPKFENLKFSPSGLAALAYASDKTMRAAPPAFFGGWLLPKLGMGITFAEERAFIHGTGAGQPMGLMNAPCKIAIAKESGQTAGTVVVANIDKMIARLYIERMAACAFLYNRPELYTQLIALVRAIGTGGELARVFQRGNVQTGESATLDGFPIIDTEFCEAAGTEGDLIFADFSQYVIADDRSGAQFAQSMHLKFDYAQEAFRILKYVDGGPINSTYFTRNKGTTTTSSILTIAVRS